MASPTCYSCIASFTHLWYLELLTQMTRRRLKEVEERGRAGTHTQTHLALELGFPFCGPEGGCRSEEFKQKVTGIHFLCQPPL